MLKIIKCDLILDNSSKFLFLASGEKNGEGFWLLGAKNTDENILSDENLLDCHRKELIGNESAKNILFAINLNLNNLLDELKKNNYLVDQPSIGISFNIPLNILENIFDFWLSHYQEKETWEKCLGLLKIRKKVSLLNLIESGSLKGDSKKWAMEIENLHCYRPNSGKSNLMKQPMWK